MEKIPYFDSEKSLQIIDNADIPFLETTEKEENNLVSDYSEEINEEEIKPEEDLHKNNLFNPFLYNSTFLDIPS